MIVMVSCRPVSRIDTGEDAYQYKRYPLAVQLLADEIENTKEDDIKARKSFWIGESYRLMNRDEASIKWYRQAYELSKNQISLEAYANAVLRSQQYSNARTLFAKLISDYGQKESWDIAVKSCDAAQAWISEQDINKYVITKSHINSAKADYGPVYFDDILVFTSDREESKGDTYHWTGERFSDFYRTRDEARLDELLYKINGPFNESSITFNHALDHIVYTQCGTSKDESDYERCRLIEGQWSEEDQAWTSFKKLSFCRDDVSYGHPTFFNYDQGLIFSSDHADGQGGFDLWITYFKNGNWTNPVLLPKGINTAGDEKFPVVLGDSLFYSSDGKVGMGGLDIFVTRFVAPDGWTAPQNLKPPINSGGDDFSFAFDPTFSRHGNVLSRFLISSNRRGSQLDDIYVFEEMLTGDEDTVVTEPEYEIVIEGKILEQIYEDEADLNSRKRGTRPLSGASLSVVDEAQFPDMVVDASGEFRITMHDEGQYRFLADKKGYLSNSKTINVELSEKDRRLGGKTYIVHIVLDPIVFNKEIVMNDIYYDFDKWDIREDAEPSLESLAELLQNNPDIKIELASHTDCQGLEIYNAELSQRRAQSAVSFLVSLGIDRRRMRAAGYGETRPAIACECESCTEEEHQANRRTSFTILSD